MGKIKYILPILFVALFAFGAKITDNDLTIGDGSAGTDKTVNMGDGRLKWDSASSKLRFSNDVGASFKDIGSGAGAGAGINILSGFNSDFESGNPPANWTASGGTFIAETSNPGFDTQSGSWDPSATSQNLDSLLRSVPLGLENRHCNATLQYKWPSGVSGQIKFQVLNSSAAVIAEKDMDPSSDWAKDALMFTCPTSESLRVRLISTADAALILVDNVTLGKNDFFDLSQTELVAQAYYNETTNCDWTRDSASFGPFGVDTDCPAITVVNSTQAVNTADNDLPDIVFNELKPGRYVVESIFQASFQDDIAHKMGFRITDGTTSGPECGKTASGAGNANGVYNFKCAYSVDVLTAQAKTFSIHAFENAAGSVFLQNSDNGENLAFTVVRYPLASAEAVTLETVGEHWDVNIGGSANAALSTGTVASYSAFGEASLDMVINPGSKSAGTQIPCEAANPSTGLTCAVGVEHVGIVIDVASSGRYRVCGAFSHAATGDVSGNVQTTFQWVETPNNAQTILQFGKSRVLSSPDNSSSTAISTALPVRLCGDFIFSNAGQKTLRLMYEQTASVTISVNAVIADRSAASGDRDIHITVDKLDQQFPTPVFTDLTNSLNSKLKAQNAGFVHCGGRILNTAGTPSISNNASDCVDSITDNGVGDWTINFSAGFFGSAPNCICASELNDFDRRCSIGAISAGSVQTKTSNSAATATDVTVQFLCTGPE